MDKHPGFLNQMRLVLKIAFVWKVGMHVCVCPCPQAMKNHSCEMKPE